MELTATSRTELGRSVKALRKQGLIPAELYGHGVSNEHVAVPARDFEKAYQEVGESSLLTLVLGKQKHPVIIHDIQRDYLTDSVVHIDFYQVRMDEKVKTLVPLVFDGEAPAVKTLGGVLNRSIVEVEIEALPADLPHRLHVDLSALAELNQSLYVKDIVVPKGVKMLFDPETVVATVTEMREEEPAPVVAEASVADVKVETEEKKVEREKAKTESEGK